MTGLDILLYTVGTAAFLYAFWIVINIIWLGIIKMYHIIDDNIYAWSFDRYRNKLDTWYEWWYHNS